MNLTFDKWIEWFQTNEPYEYGVTTSQAKQAIVDIKTVKWRVSKQDAVNLDRAFIWATTTLGHSFWSGLYNRLVTQRKIIGVENYNGK